MMRSGMSRLPALLVFALTGSVWAADLPVAVSPGNGSTVALVESRCPTFGWGEVEGATSYELVVYSLGEEGGEAREVLRQRFPGSVDGWTPAVDQCLQRGTQYAWSVRARGRQGSSSWSVPRLFEVAVGPSEAEIERAIELVRSYLSLDVQRGDEAHATSDSEGSEDQGEAEPSSGRTSPTTLAAAAPTQLSVDGNVAATSFTGDGENLDNVATDAELASHASFSSAHHIPTPQVWLKNGSTAYYTGRVRVGTSSIGTANLNAVSTFATYQSNGNRMFRTTFSTSGAGYVSTHGPNGNENLRISNASGNGNHGYLAVRDANGADQAGIYVNSSGNGIVFGDTKSFRVAHPDDPTKEIWYASIEGPEAAAYERGTAQLGSGRARVEFSDHFSALVSPSTVTVLITPLSADSKGLAVVEKSANGFTVRELHGGAGNYAFDWEVKAVRKGHEDFQVLRSAGYLERLVADEAVE